MSLPLELPENLSNSYLSGGLWDESHGTFDGILTGGLNPIELGEVAPIKPTGPSFTLVGPNGSQTQVDGSTTGINLGGQTLQLDGATGLFLPGMPAQAVEPEARADQAYRNEDDIVQSYTGADMRVLLELHDPTGRGKSIRKQLLELTTVTVSTHRVKAPVRACGYINPRGHARGGRTIAGTMILTQFTVDLMFRFLYGEYRDLSKDSRYVKPDQLPPFDLTLMFSDEFGNASYRQILGVEVENDGVIYSTNDMYTEQSISYRAADFTPLLPLDRSSLLRSNATAARAERTPMMVHRGANDKQPTDMQRDDVSSTITYGEEVLI